MDSIFELIQTLPTGFYESQIEYNHEKTKLQNEMEIGKVNLILKIPLREQIFSSSYHTFMKEFDCFFELQFIYIFCTFYEQYQIFKKAADEQILNACKIKLNDLYPFLKKYKSEGDIENEVKIQKEINHILLQNKTIHQSKELFDKFNKEVDNYRNTIYDSLQKVYQVYKKKIQKCLKPFFTLEVYEKTILDIMKDFSRLLIEYYEEYLLGIKSKKTFWCNCSTCMEEKRGKNDYMNDKMIMIRKELETIFSLIPLYHSNLFLEDS